MSLLISIIPIGIVVAAIGGVLTVVGLFVKKEQQRFSGTEVVLGGIQFLALAATVLAAVTVLFAAVDHMVPDVLVDAAARDNTAIRSALAIMLVTTPIFAVVVRKMSRPVSWMERFTASGILLIAGAVGVGVVIALVYNFLAGELGMRLFMKLVVLGIMAGGIGWYYSLFVRDGKTVSVRATRTFLIMTGFVVVAAVVWGFAISGGPFAARAERFDDRRLSDLYGMQSQVQTYWQENGRLPTTIADLNNPLTNYAVPKDPETGAPYVYRRVSETSEPHPTDPSAHRRVGTFEICATFVTERMVGAGAGMQAAPSKYMFDDSFVPYYYRDDVSPHWNHGVGTTCFTRTLKEPIAPVPMSI